MTTAPTTLAGKSLWIGRLAASALIAGVARRYSVKDVNDRLAAKPLKEQGLIVGGVMLLLFLAAILAAQFGIVGMLVYLIALIVIVN
ncbi:MAG: hypothetical protein AAFR34_02080 [Pseudomonadota bacterium]